MDPVKYFITFILGLSSLFSLIYGIQLGYYKERNMEMKLSLKDSGLTTTALFVTFCFFLF